VLRGAGRIRSSWRLTVLPARGPTRSRSGRSRRCSRACSTTTRWTASGFWSRGSASVAEVLGSWRPGKRISSPRPFPWRPRPSMSQSTGWGPSRPTSSNTRDDAVVRFAPAERIARQLEQMGRPVRFEALRDFGHFEMGGYVDALRRAGRSIAERWNRQARMTAPCRAAAASSTRHRARCCGLAGTPPRSRREPDDPDVLRPGNGAFHFAVASRYPQWRT
jgi:hypothetical protein